MCVQVCSWLYAGGGQFDGGGEGLIEGVVGSKEQEARRWGESAGQTPHGRESTGLTARVDLSRIQCTSLHRGSARAASLHHGCSHASATTPWPLAVRAMQAGSLGATAEPLHQEAPSSAEPELVNGTRSMELRGKVMLLSSAPVPFAATKSESAGGKAQRSAVIKPVKASSCLPLPGLAIHGDVHASTSARRFGPL